MILCATTSVSRIRRGRMIAPAVSPATMIAETVVDSLTTPGVVVEDVDVVVAEVKILGVTMDLRGTQVHAKLAVSLVMKLLNAGSSRTP